MKPAKLSINESNPSGGIAKPFVKWAGGKRRLYDLYMPFFPSEFKRYFEPFVGGGAILFNLLEHFPSVQATIMDTNEELINCYEIIKNDVELLLNALDNHKQGHSKEYYYAVREWDQDLAIYQKLTKIDRAARVIYLNKTCFNGLYRVNSHGHFNVPFGRYKNPQIFDPDNLRAVSQALQNVSIQINSYEKVLDLAEKDDFVYFDPPYQPISATSNFTSYTSENFNEESQRKLRKVFQSLDERGCYVALSNSANGFIQDLYGDLEGIQIIEVHAPRAINRDGSKRGKVPEILILGQKLSRLKH